MRIAAAVVLGACLVATEARAQFVGEPPPAVVEPAPAAAPSQVAVPSPTVPTEATAPTTPPTEKEAEPRPLTRRQGLARIGAWLLGVGFAQSLMVGLEEGAGAGRWSPGLFIPVVGPLLIKFNDYGSELAFVLNSAAQIAGTGLLIAALATRSTDERVPVPVPLALDHGAGIGLAGSF